MAREEFVFRSAQPKGESVPEETTWAARLDAQEIEVRPVREGRKRLRAGQLMLYPNGRAVESVIRTIPEGGTMSRRELLAELARRHGAEITCPVTTGTCLRDVAEAAYEAFAGGTPIAEVAPVWRVLDATSPTLRKVSFDPAFVLDQRARERR
jgi:hypothetical protein